MQSTSPDKPNLIPLEDSHRDPLLCPHVKHAVALDGTARVTVVFQPEAPPTAYAELEAYAHAQGLTVIEHVGRNVKLEGSIAALQQAFAVTLEHCTVDGVQFCGRSGVISVPEAIHPHVMAVLGLDDRPVAKPYIRRPRSSSPTPLYAPQVGFAYHYPTDATGKGQRVAIIELGGGYQTSDFEEYFSKLKLKVPEINSVSVDGATNSPGSDADGEVCLDVETVGAIAPDAVIDVYYAPNSDSGFVNAVTEAAHAANKPTAISISWGGPEVSWTKQGLRALSAAIEEATGLGIVVTAAAGDGGASDSAEGLHVDFPASSPYALACGGTRLTLKLNGSVETESAWNDGSQGGATGGGVSNFFPVPAYQEGLKLPLSPTNFKGRAVPDVAANGDPESGYWCFVDGDWGPVGGTSAVAPLLAGLTALFAEKLGKPLPFLHPLLYKAPATCYWDVKAGNNDADGQGGYSAARGYDECTGLGSPLGNALFKYLASELSK